MDRPTSQGGGGRRRRWPAGLAAALAAGAAAGLLLPAPDEYRWEVLDSLTADRVESVRRDPTAVGPMYAECRDELADDLGRPFADLADDDRRLVFCMLVAYAMAPYGQSNVVELPDLLAAPYLNCGNYPFLMIRLYEILAAADRRPVCLVGWEGGAVGNHAMAYRPDPDGKRGLFLDPTVGVVARATFDEVAAGKPVRADRVVYFGTRESDAPFGDLVAKAFAGGRYRPSDVLFYFESLDHQLGRTGGPKDWPTPGAQRWRELRRRMAESDRQSLGSPPPSP